MRKLRDLAPNKMSVRASEAELERVVQGARRILARRQGDGKGFGAAIDASSSSPNPVHQPSELAALAESSSVDPQLAGTSAPRSGRASGGGPAHPISIDATHGAQATAAR